MRRPPTAEAEIAEELAGVRPELIPAFLAGLAGARAATADTTENARANTTRRWFFRLSILRILCLAMAY